MLQSPFWAEVKKAFGWQCLRLPHLAGEGPQIQVLIRRLAPGIALAYVPYPSIPEPVGEPGQTLGNLAKAMAPHLPRNVLFIRFDLPWQREGEGNLPPRLPRLTRLHKAPVDIQPPSTVIINLRQSEKELLADMKPKTRYNIRLAGRKGVEIVTCGEEDEEALSTWYSLYEETARRDKITIHTDSYYKRLFRLSRDTKEVQIKLLMAKVEGDPVAGIIVAFYAGSATYLYGASSDRKRNYMPNYALQWEAIRQATEAGCTTYDFFGIPEHPGPGHPMSGLYRFKTGFGGAIVNRFGCYDYALSLPGYNACRLAETLRHYYYKRWRKRG